MGLVAWLFEIEINEAGSVAVAFILGQIAAEWIIFLWVLRTIFGAGGGDIDPGGL